MAGELGDVETCALGRHWLLYDLAELGELDEAWRRHSRARAACRGAPAAALPALVARRGGACWRGWRADSMRPSGSRATPSLWPNGRGRRRRAAHFTPSSSALRREQGRLRRVLPEIERLAGDEPAAAAWRGILPLAYLDAGDRVRAQRRVRASARRAGCRAVRGPCSGWRPWRRWPRRPPLGDADRRGAAVRRARAVRRSSRAVELHGQRRLRAPPAGSDGGRRRRRDRARAHFEAALRRHAALGCGAAAGPDAL